MTPIQVNVLLTQMRWTLFILLPRLNPGTAGLAGVFLGFLIFYLVIPLIQAYWNLLPLTLTGMLPGQF
ncbi:MAG: hypothetical protein ACWGO1_08895 [Anaerolineales bacterium]